MSADYFRDVDLTETQAALADNVLAGMRSFPLAYWRDLDQAGRFPHEFFSFAARQGWLGIAMPEKYGGAGLGISEATVLLEAVARTGGLSATSAIHMNIFGVNVVVKHGHQEMQTSILPAVVRGELKVAF